MLGVVTEHFPRAGDSQLTVTPITQVSSLPPARRRAWEQAMGIDFEKLPVYEANLEPVRKLIHPSRNIAALACVAAVLGGSLAGLVVQRLDWAVAFAIMVLVAVVSANAGVKLLRIDSILEGLQQSSDQVAIRPSAADTTIRRVEVAAATIDMKHSVIAAGDVNQVRKTNIRLGGLAAIAVAGVMTLASVSGTAAISSLTDSPDSQGPTAWSSPVAVDAARSDMQTGSVNRGAWSCPSADRIGSEHVALLAEDATFAQLVAALEGMKAHGARVSHAATALADAIGRLTPPPTTSVEALGRLRFVNSDVDAMLASLNSAVLDACGNPEFADSELAYFKEQVRPRPIPGGVLTGEVYGQCGSAELGWIAPFTQVIDCQNGTVAAVDMTTGSVTRLTGFPSGSTTGIKLAGEKLVWGTVATQPAQGLSEETWKATLHIRDVLTGNETTAPADEGKGTAIPESDVILGAWPDRILLSAGQKSRMVDGTGRTLWTSAGYTGHVSDRPTASTLWIDPLLIDLNTGKVIRDYGPATLNIPYADNGCENSAVLPDYRDGIWITESVTGKRTVRALTKEFHRKVNALKPTTHTLVNKDSTGGLHGVTLAGKVNWNVPTKIVKSFEILGRWIVVTYQSGNRVLVDAATGVDETRAQTTVADALFRSGEKIHLTHSDPADDLALVRGDADGGIVLRASWSAICL
ncbi:hypothetical protein O7626_03275 [Micromonospora sp. WMMD1102]|uniref:hypothetical protein n=1 Tax=Micromonospora sp. WMMD1102 TaxID=3016105 RepID=UPI0024151630|nr:hypothetical protein [Micromonospora sp. WMMD1102]MDG4784963.1 hypothetical protein [Micromonospora sp. WMMD1102]